MWTHEFREPSLRASDFLVHKVDKQLKKELLLLNDLHKCIRNIQVFFCFIDTLYAMQH